LGSVAHAPSDGVEISQSVFRGGENLVLPNSFGVVNLHARDVTVDRESCRELLCWFYFESTPASNSFVPSNDAPCSTNGVCSATLSRAQPRRFGAETLEDARLLYLTEQHHSILRGNGTIVLQDGRAFHLRLISIHSASVS